CALADFDRGAGSTPFLKDALTLSSSTSNGSASRRSKRPQLHSEYWRHLSSPSERFSPRMVRTPSWINSSTSFSSRLGSSAATRSPVSLSVTSSFGQDEKELNSAGDPKPRSASSNSRLTSRCKARNGLV